ncbi:hypothetical protein PQR33_35950 [Paraburkholderia sediminicola]|uniref:hypothetical protein n=1 Tax=Paraburkholderia sediminicola TaxID=458836 RepID=UPI0038B772C3
MSASLEHKQAYCDKKDYLNSAVLALVFLGNFAKPMLHETRRISQIPDVSRGREPNVKGQN